jgi:hypothetical protein
LVDHNNLLSLPTVDVKEQTWFQRLATHGSERYIGAVRDDRVNAENAQFNDPCRVIDSPGIHAIAALFGPGDIPRIDHRMMWMSRFMSKAKHQPSLA